MSTPSLTLFNIEDRAIIISPLRRFKTIITIKGERFFGRILDRDNRDAVIVEREDDSLVILLARLVACGIGEAVFCAPSGFRRVGVRNVSERQSFGCYALDETNEPCAPIVIVGYTGFWATVLLPGNEQLQLRGESPEETMLRAVMTFIDHAVAA